MHFSSLNSSSSLFNNKSAPSGLFIVREFIVKLNIKQELRRSSVDMEEYNLRCVS